jgi:hypothetical protein
MKATELYKESFEQGDTVEKYFEKICEKNNIKTVEATKYQNIYEHIDYFMTIEDKIYSVDVKDERKKHRYDSDTAEKVIWLEIKNVNGNVGWLYGKADLIAFKHIDDFILVKRVDLIILLEEKRLKWDDGRYKKGRDFYYTHTRDGRKDELVMFHVNDILLLKHKILK